MLFHQLKVSSLILNIHWNRPRKSSALVLLKGQGVWKNNHLPEVEGEERKLTEVSPTLKDVSPVHLQQDDVNLGHHLPDEEILCFCLDLSHLSLLVNMIMSSQYQVHLNNPL